MNAIAQFVRTTIVGGIIFLAPIVTLIVILPKAFDDSKKGFWIATSPIAIASEKAGASVSRRLAHGCSAVL
jgi:hypothetical protein